MELLGPPLRFVRAHMRSKMHCALTQSYLCNLHNCSRSASTSFLTAFLGLVPLLPIPLQASEEQWLQSVIAQWFEPGEDLVEEPSNCVFSIISSHDMTRAEAALVPVREA